MVEEDLVDTTAVQVALEGAKAREVSVEDQEVITVADQAGLVDLAEWEEGQEDHLVVEGLGNGNARYPVIEDSSIQQAVRNCPALPDHASQNTKQVIHQSQNAIRSLPSA